MSPTQRTLKALREAGWLAHVVEKWISYDKGAAKAKGRPGSRVDVFGFGDVLACRPEAGIVLVQATGGGNASARIDKITTECDANALWWLHSGGRIIVGDGRKVRREIFVKDEDSKIFGQSMGVRTVRRPRYTELFSGSSPGRIFYTKEHGEDLP